MDLARQALHSAAYHCVKECLDGAIKSTHLSLRLIALLHRCRSRHSAAEGALQLARGCVSCTRLKAVAGTSGPCVEKTMPVAEVPELPSRRRTQRSQPLILRPGARTVLVCLEGPLDKTVGVISDAAMKWTLTQLVVVSPRRVGEGAYRLADLARKACPTRRNGGDEAVVAVRLSPFPTLRATIVARELPYQ